MVKKISAKKRLVPTYKEIQGLIRLLFGTYVKNCWIADVKELCGLSGGAPNRRQNPQQRKYPCPPELITYIVYIIQSHRAI